MWYKKSIMTAVLVLVISTSIPAFSWPLGIGVTSYYSYWNPAWSEGFDNVEIDPALLVGPVLSLTVFDTFTLTGFMMVSVNNPRSRYSLPLAGVGNVGIVSNVERLEAELSLMYLVNRYFRILAGYKTQLYNEEDTPETVIVPVGYTSRVDFWKNSFQISGPGAGMALILPVADAFSLSISTSLIYLAIDHTSPRLKQMGMEIYSEGIDYNYTGTGNNTAITASYYFPSMNTVISLGGRFQFLHYKAEGDAPSMGNDYYYGITFAALYLFY
ncbi:MAG: hypothetical protein KBA61_08930 [Spirochaetes bacterium]|nr:hypothetical protein [Spirochaetota bacterium]